MRLLVITQKVDLNDPVLGFFHNWLIEFSKKFESLIVICLEKGKHDLPANVRVLSLGKEEGRSHVEYISRFYRHIWREKDNYDAVLVHMNQEYVLLAGEMWWLWGKKVYMWRNHQHGDILTSVAISLSHKVFYTSPSSFTAKSKKSRQMPVGIDTEKFKPDSSVSKPQGSMLFLGRIGPVKRVLEFIDWLKELEQKDERFTATIAGEALPKDKDYESRVREKVREYGLGDRVKFVGAVTQDEAVKLYQSHEKYVNKTPAGSYDKTILEAAASEMEVIVDNEDVRAELLDKSPQELRQYVIENHSLKKLSERLKEEIDGK